MPLAVLDDVIESLVDVITTYRTGKAPSDERSSTPPRPPRPTPASGMGPTRGIADPRLAPLNLFPGSSV